MLSVFKNWCCIFSVAWCCFDCNLELFSVPKWSLMSTILWWPLCNIERTSLSLDQGSYCVGCLRKPFNTIQLSFDITLRTLRSEVHLHGSADAVVLQSNCVRRTFSRSLHCCCLGRGSNLYFLCFRLSAPPNCPGSLVSKLRYTQHIMALQISMWNQMSNIDCRISTSVNLNKIMN